MRRATRLVPGWLLGIIANLVGAVILFFRRDAFNENLPTYRGLHLWLEGVNADLYLEHLKPALDLIDAYAPVYLRWLRSRFQAVVVSQIFMIMRTVTVVDVRRRRFAVHPYTVWKVSPEQLAVHLVRGATRGRLGIRFARKKAGVRADRRVLEEAVAFARKLPNGGTVVETWERHLATFNQRFPQAAA